MFNPLQSLCRIPTFFHPISKRSDRDIKHKREMFYYLAILFKSFSKLIKTSKPLVVNYQNCISLTSLYNIVDWRLANVAPHLNFLTEKKKRFLFFHIILCIIFSLRIYYAFNFQEKMRKTYIFLLFI